MARPPDRQLDDAISRATLRLLGEVGFERLSIAAVATKAGTARTSVYRRWPDKKALVLAAVRHEFASPADEIDTGTLRGDLLAQARTLAERLGQHAGVLSGLLIAVRDNGELGRLVRSSIVERDRTIMTVAIGRAKARGELAGPVADIVTTVPMSLLFARILLLDEPLDDAYLTRMVDQVVMPLFQEYRAA
ncbi:TetR/AcrR family transcriptional regulator [Kibdelosporangium aridum]|uniref:TetR/AcrR family transcriptional regulator n=1 Tax=Kibdelosporangium aridum TaxID=2030 RepID=UPI0035EDC6D3